MMQIGFNRSFFTNLAVGFFLGVVTYYLLRRFGLREDLDEKG